MSFSLNAARLPRCLLPRTQFGGLTPDCWSPRGGAMAGENSPSQQALGPLESATGFPPVALPATNDHHCVAERNAGRDTEPEECPDFPPLHATNAGRPRCFRVRFEVRGRHLAGGVVDQSQQREFGPSPFQSIVAGAGQSRADNQKTKFSFHFGHLSIFSNGLGIDPYAGNIPRKSLRKY